MKVTEEYYEAHIPRCCRLQTWKEHADELMLCWGLLHDLESGIIREDCGRECDLHINHDPILLDEILHGKRQ